MGGAAMSKVELARMVALEEMAALGTLKPKEADRLSVLRDMLTRQQAEELPCPFRTDSPHPTCTKPGGVCSIRIYREEAGTIEPIDGERGRLRALCPWRFHQDGTAFDKIGESLLSDPAPLRAGEVGFLESTGNLDSDPGEPLSAFQASRPTSAMRAAATPLVSAQRIAEDRHVALAPPLAANRPPAGDHGLVDPKCYRPARHQGPVGFAPVRYAVAGLRLRGGRVEDALYHPTRGSLSPPERTPLISASSMQQGPTLVAQAGRKGAGGG
jgi:hypothetical protein